MNVSDKDTEELKPVLKIIFYENRDNVYAEYCKIVQRKKKFIGQSMKPVSYVALQGFIETIKPKVNMEGVTQMMNFNSLIPSNVLHYRENSLLPDITWFVKGQVRPIKTTFKSGKLFYPHLIFQVRDNQLKIFAIKTMNINEKTEVFNAPFPNVYDDGHLCFGTMKYDDFTSGDYRKIMANFEDAFFNSKFTSELMGTFRSKGDINKLLKKLIIGKSGVPKRFPKKELIKYGNLKNVIS